jgi:hypothetical protein
VKPPHLTTSSGASSSVTLPLKMILSWWPSPTPGVLPPISASTVELSVTLKLIVATPGLAPIVSPPSKRASPLPVKLPSPDTGPKKLAAPPLLTRSSPSLRRAP